MRGWRCLTTAVCGGRQDASTAVKATVVSSDAGAQERLRIIDGRFVDSRWVGGRWVLSEFASAGGVMDYSAWEKVTPSAFSSHNVPHMLSCEAHGCMHARAQGCTSACLDGVRRPCTRDIPIRRLAFSMRASYYMHVRRLVGGSLRWQGGRALMPA